MPRVEPSPGPPGQRAEALREPEALAPHGAPAQEAVQRRQTRVQAQVAALLRARSVSGAEEEALRTLILIHAPAWPVAPQELEAAEVAPAPAPAPALASRPEASMASTAASE